MDLSSREFWALVHGIVLGGAFLVAFTGGLAGFYEAGSAAGVRRDHDLLRLVGGLADGEELASR